MHQLLDRSWETAGLPDIDISIMTTDTRKRKGGPANGTAGKKERRPVMGRPLLLEEFPDVVPVATAFVESNGFRAHCRRREEIGTCGTSIPAIKEHLIETVPGLIERYPRLSDSTIARMMKPPNKTRNSSKRYKGVIDARVPSKENSVRKVNENSHYYSARVKYAMEFASLVGEGALVYSADNKNKLKVGDKIPAVDRRLKPNTIFPAQDRPNLYDHDFPTPGYLITPAGYLQMTPSTDTTTDELGRERYEIPKRGQATVVLRGPHSPMNIASHLDDMRSVIDIGGLVKAGKSLLVMIVDGGPDYNVNHATNEYFYGRFFRDMNLDGLIVTSYCPGDSALNPIEHVWAPTTKALNSVFLPSTLPGDRAPPIFLSGLTTEEKRQKEHVVFNEAMRRVKDAYWAKVKFAGEVINTHVIPSEQAEGGYGVQYQVTKTIIAKSALQLRQHREIHGHHSFNSRHLDRRIGTIIYSKCTSQQCQHCSSHPPQLSADIMATLRRFPSPRPSSIPEHFMSLREVLAAERAATCDHLPLFRIKGLGRCEVRDCRYVFTSQSDVLSHRRKVHGR